MGSADSLLKVDCIDERFVAEFINKKADEHKSVALANLRSLGRLGDSIQRYVLGRLTHYIETEAGQATKQLERFFDGEAVTIEHIFPQHASGSALDPFSKVDNPDDYIYALGNLALLYRAPNSMIGNREYSVKKKAFKVPGSFMSKSISQGRNTKYTFLDRKPEHFGSWKPSSVKSRTEDLVELAIELWSLK